MRKIPAELDNPIDNQIVKVCARVAPWFKAWHFTPNHITTLSLGTGLYAAYLFKQEYYRCAAGLFALSYFFDCLDGYYARKYNMVTTFGDYYDHISDATKFMVLMVVFYTKCPNFSSYVAIGFLLFFGLMSVHVGCTEQLHDQEDHSPSLSVFKHLCSNHQRIHWAKFFGPGTLISITVFIILYFPQFRNMACIR